MANIIIPRSWEKIAPKADDEKIYLKRRDMLKQLGIIGGGLVMSTFMASCREDVSKVPNEFVFEGMDQLYPASPNTEYPLDRPITEEEAATHHNNFYEFIHPDDSNIYNTHKYVSDFDNRDWHIEVEGLADNTGTFFLGDLMKEMGLEERTYRHRCVEAWAMAVPWTGFSLAKLIKYFKPQNEATYIRMYSYANQDQMVGIRTQEWYPWPYFEGLRMDEAMNELPFVATGLYGKPLPKQNGAPVRLVVPWKYGYKSIKSIVKIEFVDFKPETFWHKVVPSQYGFISNVDPNIPHPAWSQKNEFLLGSGRRVATRKFNGYGDWVGHLY